MDVGKSWSLFSPYGDRSAAAHLRQHLIIPNYLLPHTSTTTAQQLRFSSSSSSSRPPSSPPPPPPPSTTASTPNDQSSLPHLTPSGAAHMVPIHLKPTTHRTATAACTIHFTTPHPAHLIRHNLLKKGDALGVARIAGIQAAKLAPTLIPLCHPIELTGVEVVAELVGGEGVGEGEGDAGFGAVEVKATVECVGRTGVEMEALTSVVGAALAVVDMVKAVDRGVWIGEVRVVEKKGGRSGWWRREEGGGGEAGGMGKVVEGEGEVEGK